MEFEDRFSTEEACRQHLVRSKPVVTACNELWRSSLGSSNRRSVNAERAATPLNSVSNGRAYTSTSTTFSLQMWTFPHYSPTTASKEQSA